MKSSQTAALSAIFACVLTVLPACEDKKAPAPAPSGTSTTQPPADHKDAAAGHGGSVIQLGTTTIGVFGVKATRDEGQIVAGKDAPIDVTVTPSPGSTAKAVAVRFWIGTEDAKGSVKAKADIENPAEPDRWHTHAEIPNPIPAGSKLWVEVEDAAGGRSTGSFELKG